MILNKKYIGLLFSIAVVSCTQRPIKLPVLKNPTQEIATEPTLIKIGKEGLTQKQLVTALQNTTSLDSSSADELINEILQKQLFITEARAQGMDTTADFRERIKSNAKYAVQNFLEDRTSIAILGNEAFQRYQKEINVSHIFIPVSPFASPEDTLKAYNELLAIRNAAIQTKDFEGQAAKWSRDAKTTAKGGNLGWFSTFHLVYPLETIAYKTPIDSISFPIRSSNGYHLIKKNGERNNSGTVKIKHIYKHFDQNTSFSELSAIKSELDSIRIELENGANFDEMVLNHSEDYLTKDSGGLLPEFGYGTRMESSIEDAAFALKIGQVSPVITSSTGLHLLKLIEKNPPLDKTKFLEFNESKLTTDSRAEFLSQKRIQALKTIYNITIHHNSKDNALKFASIKILNRNWEKPNSSISNDKLLSINSTHYTIGDFFNYVEDRQEFEKWPSEKPQEIFNMLLQKYINARIIEYQEKETLESQPDIQRWVKAQTENMLYTEFVDQNVILKSNRDTLALKNFYENNKALFTANEIGTISVLSFKDNETYLKFKELAASDKPYRLYRGIKGIQYEQNTYTLTPQDERKLLGLIEILNENPSFIVEVSGHIDSNEDEDISELRIKEVVNFLVKNKVPLNRILEMNYKNSVILDRFDWSKNQIVNFQFFSNLESDLAVTFNSKNENAVTFDEFQISRKDFEAKMKTPWGSKTGLIRVDGKVEQYTLKVRKTKGSYLDHKPEVIRMYQESLKKELQKKLAEKYNLTYNPAEIISIINDLKRTN